MNPTEHEKQIAREAASLVMHRYSCGQRGSDIVEPILAAITAAKQQQNEDAARRIEALERGLQMFVDMQTAWKRGENTLVDFERMQRVAQELLAARGVQPAAKQESAPATEQELPGMMQLAQGVRDQRWPHTVDAQVWAEEWAKTLAEHPDIVSDKGCMIGWFANAIMAGYDTASMCAPSPAQAEDTKCPKCGNIITPVRECWACHTEIPAAEQAILGHGWQTFNTVEQRWYYGPIMQTSAKPENELTEGWEWREVVIIPAPSPEHEKPVAASVEEIALKATSSVRGYFGKPWHAMLDQRDHDQIYTIIYRALASASSPSATTR